MVLEKLTCLPENNTIISVSQIIYRNMFFVNQKTKRKTANFKLSLVVLSNNFHGFGIGKEFLNKMKT